MVRRSRVAVLAFALVVLLSGCDWSMFRLNPAHSGASSDKRIVKNAVPTSMVLDWKATTGGSIFSSPAISNGVAYVGSDDHKLYAFDASGNTDCSGTPKTCSPLWTATTGDRVLSSPAVSNGVVYVGSQDGLLYAFDAAGNTNCSGTPKTCLPLWTATTGGGVESSPVVVNGVVYVGSLDFNLYAFDANGNTNCSGTPKTCSPLWIGPTGGDVASSPAVSNGVVYVGSDDGKLYAFDAAGKTNCVTTTITTCGPLWTATTGANIFSSPTVANGVVYVGSADTNLYAFDANGNTNCSGTPKTCRPLWTGITGDGPITPGGVLSSPAVANGTVFVGDANGYLMAYDAAGKKNCFVSPAECLPEQGSGGPAGAAINSSPAIANGVVWVGSEDGKLYAFDATGGCSPCPPGFTATTGGAIDSSPAVANGMVYVGSSDHNLYVYGMEKVPPTTTIVTPAGGATVSATTTLDATASDNVSVSTVAFHLINGSNDTLLGNGTPDGTGHWKLNWNTTTVANGTYKLHSVATDPAGNHGQSPDVTITVHN
jgi:outer membrane protein assembly factor BamB